MDGATIGSGVATDAPIEKMMPGETHGILRAKQRPEAFLFEMLVVGENFFQSFPLHRLHRNAIDQAVAFVRAGEIKIETEHEAFMALRNDANLRVGENGFDRHPGPASKMLRRTREKRQVLAKHFFCRHDIVGYALGLSVSGFAGKGKSDPVKRVGKNRAHTLRFGSP